MKVDEERRYVEYVAARLPWIRKVAFLLCQDWHRADDIAQAAITRLYLHWRRADGADSLDAYVRTMVVRVFLSERRSGWASRVDLRAEPQDRPGPADDDPAMRLAVRRALAEVPPRQRAALVLRYYCDLSVEDAAEALGCSTGTVKSQTARGLEALRRALDAHQVGIEG
ncbi:SigE family RNA polymerase sigma factor [Dactylosporangium salmoneum]|uniref:SigE family RNA polymerase sigma factor n=1 Tax=Dactylosporangium salmoneum TaxID=53361 RepID=A0ABN3HQ67_9ACTN